jgi:hypothetical protein
MSFPYLDLLGFRRRTTMQEADVDAIETRSPGFLVGRIKTRTSRLNARLRKRYGNAVNVGNGLPWGNVPPTLIPNGTLPPAVFLSGKPTLGSLEILINVTTPGILGVALFSWSKDAGVSFVATGAVTAPIVVFGGTGLSANFSNLSSYSADNVYQAASPVPEVILDWLTVLVTVDAYAKRGVNPSDPQIVQLMTEYDRVLAEVKEAADSKDGLIDIPVSEDQDSAVTTGGPLGYSETSPYVWATQEQLQGELEDQSGAGTGS